MISLGIDPSTFTGIVRIEGEDSVGKAINFPKLKGFQRLHALGEEIARTVNLWKPDIVVIEGYAYGNTHTIVTLVEIGATIRHGLYSLGLNWYDCPPTTLKKWVTGKGSAKKPEVGLHVKSRWGFVSASDDIVDAYALSQLGQHIGTQGVTPDLKGVVRGW